MAWLPICAHAADWHLAFEGHARVAGREPVEATAISFAPGKEGQGVSLKRGSRLAYDPADLNREEFTVDFWVKHPKPLRDYFYREMTCLYHETADEKNRIGFVKRSATSYFVFYFGNGQGGGKGQNFAGNWFSLKTPVFDWPADTWHHITLTASKAARRAQVVIDGQLCAEATGDQFPERWGERLWVGSRKGASPVEGVLDELRLGPPKFAEGLPKALAAQFTPPEPQRPPRRRGGKELTLNLDFFDICIGTDCWDMEDCVGEMDRIMRLSAHYGVDRILFRVSVCGAVCYRSKAVQACNDACFEKYHREILDTPIGNLPSFIPNMAEVMRRMDPLAEAVKAGHRYGIEVWGWSTTFDSLYYAPPGEFFREHPDYTWQGRDGKKFIPGVPCYAYPEVRAYRLAEIRFVKLKGEHLTRFLREVKAEAVKFGKPVAINATGDAVDPVNAGRMFVDFDTLARERLVDELCLISGASADLMRWRMLSDGKVRLTTFSGIHGKTYERCLPLLRDGILAVLKNPTSDGACFHELGNAYYLDLWEEGIAEAYSTSGKQ